MKVETIKKNLKKYKEFPSEHTLFKEEIDVILAVMFQVLGEKFPKKGSFMLAGKKEGGELETIVEFNFPGGKQKRFLGQYQDSDVMASYNVYNMSTFSHEPGSKAIKYQYNSPEVMALHTTNGQFVAAFFADNGGFSTQERAYHAMIEAIALLGRDDVGLKDSFKKTFELDAESNPDLDKLETFVRFLFETQELPEIKTWSAWRDKDKPRIFFE